MNTNFSVSQHWRADGAIISIIQSNKRESETGLSVLS